jgi:hypothetical protein
MWIACSESFPRIDGFGKLLIVRRSFGTVINLKTYNQILMETLPEAVIAT